MYQAMYSGAIRYCNWLSTQNNMDKTYQFYCPVPSVQDIRISKDNTKTGYRLPDRDQVDYAKQYLQEEMNYADPYTIISANRLDPHDVTRVGSYNTQVYAFRVIYPAE